MFLIMLVVHIVKKCQQKKKSEQLTNYGLAVKSSIQTGRYSGKSEIEN